MRMLIVFIITSAVCFSCSKKSGDNNQNKESKFSFEFNGTKYNDPGNGGVIINSGLDGIFINRPDLFGGTINFYRNSSLNNNCAFLIPVGFQYALQQPGCILSTSTPIDSVQIYFFRSGTINYTTSNCRRKKEPDVVFGGYLEYDLCDVTGTFTLTLGNKNNQTIVITKGEFSFPDIKF